MVKCLFCEVELVITNEVEIQEYQTVKSSKVPFGWMYLSENETDPSLVDVHHIPLPKEKKASALCPTCGADCDLVWDGSDWILTEARING